MKYYTSVHMEYGSKSKNRPDQYNTVKHCNDEWFDTKYFKAGAYGSKAFLCTLFSLKYCILLEKHWSFVRRDTKL